MGETVLLAVDTSDCGSSVAVVRKSSYVASEEVADYQVLAKASSDLARWQNCASQASHGGLHQLVKECLEAAKLSEGLSAIVIGAGPGSFTGLRVGYAFCKGLASALRVNLVSSPSFYGVAAGYTASQPSLNAQVLVVADARREQLFCSSFRVVKGALNLVVQAGLGSSETRIVSFGELSSLAQSADETIVLLRPSALRVQEQIVASLPETVRLACSDESQVASSLPRVMARGLATSFSVHELSAAAPSYLREVAARTLLERGVV